MRKVSVLVLVMLFSLFNSFFMAGASTVNPKLGVGADQVVGSESNFLVNGDFETGDFSGWSVGGVCSVRSTVVHNGSYSAYVSDETYDSWITQNLLEPADRDWHFEAWVYPLKVGNLGDAYCASSQIQLWFYNATTMTPAFVVNYLWCWNNDHYVNGNTSRAVQFLLPFAASTWNLLSRNVTQDVLQYFIGINLSEYVLHDVLAWYHYSNGNPGAFYLDDLKISAPSSPRTVTVPDDYPTIQAAINAVNPGDTVFVRNGTYYENVVVNKQVRLLGENRIGTIIDANATGIVLNVVASNVSVSGFTIKGGGQTSPDSGVLIQGAANCSIFGNRIIGNLGDGIFLMGCSNNAIFGNEVVGNDVDGISVSGSTGNSISDNNVTGNGWSGIGLFGYSSENNVTSNIVVNNPEGIAVVISALNEISQNSIMSNSNWGLSIYESLNNSIFHNNFNNSLQVNSDSSPTMWDNSYPAGGNYWSDYTGIDVKSGPNQDQPGSDGIGDSPHVIDATNQDNYPLMKPYVPFENQTIHIRADGSVDPSGAPILEKGDLYTLTGNITNNADGIVIERDNMTLDGAGCTVTGSEGGNGIRLSSISNVLIEGMMIRNFTDGIYLESSDNDTLSCNTVANNGDGIHFSYSSNNTLSGNNATANSWAGIFLGHSSNSTLSGSNVANNSLGIELDVSADNNVLSGNSVTANSVGGIALYSFSDNNVLSGNNATNNYDGISLESSSDNNTLSGNNVTANNGYGILVYSASENFIFHNSFVNNANQAYTKFSANIWDDGYPSGGNYWSDYKGKDFFSGPYQNQTGSDGISDTFYVIDNNNTDHYPLMQPWAGARASAKTESPRLPTEIFQPCLL